MKQQILMVLSCRASRQSSTCSGRHKHRHRRRILQEAQPGQDSPGPGCLCPTYSGAPAILSSTFIWDSQPMRLSQLTGAQTYSGAQAILFSLAQLYIRLYMEKTTHYLKKTEDLAQTFCNGFGTKTFTYLNAPVWEL